MSRVLLVSQGPVPTPEYQRVEGGGLRVWGLAKGLTANGHEVSVAVDPGYPQTLASHESIALLNSSSSTSFAALANTFDALVISYSLGRFTDHLLSQLSEDMLAVVDAYVPIHIEVAARRASDRVSEYDSFMRDSQVWTRNLTRADVILCASLVQQHYYTGILASQALINPFTYEDVRILQVPFGVDDVCDEVASINPYSIVGVEDGDFVLLWFGGVYPWFDAKAIVEGIRAACFAAPRLRFVLVGGRNPFNQHPDFTSGLDLVERGLADLVPSQVTFVDWIDYAKRIPWLQHADAVLSLNTLGQENAYSWRTRIVDYLGAGVPIISNGGDALTDTLLASGGAVPTGSSATELTATIVALVEQPDRLAESRQVLKTMRDAYRWAEVTRNLSEYIESGARPRRAERKFSDMAGLAPRLTLVSQRQRLMDEGLRLAGEVRRAGPRRVARYAFQAMRTRFSSQLH